MTTISSLSLLLGLVLAPQTPPGAADGPDPTELRERLYDRQHPHAQHQAAMMLVQSHRPEAVRIVRQGLLQPEDTEVFLALASALRLAPDARYLGELLAALTTAHPGARQVAAETLAATPAADLVPRLRAVAMNGKLDPAARRAALWALGRSGRRQAAPILLDQLNDADGPLRGAAADALADLSGQNYGLDADRWQAWWEHYHDLTDERWLELRLAHQTSRAHRLEGDLARARAQLLHVHQQLFNRLPAGERLGHIEATIEQEDPAARILAASWALELLPGADPARERALTVILLRLSRDREAEVQRAAVLGLGRVNDADAFTRLSELVWRGRTLLRAAAVRSLALQARSRGSSADRTREVVAVLQKALDDPALDVVVEAAEALGTLGASEAGPVLIRLLGHTSENVRQTAAQALERVADASLLDGLVKGLEDSSVTVRFGLVGALARVLQDRGLPEGKKNQLLARLEGVLANDKDAGVRSRVAMVLGEYGSPALLRALWQCARTGEDERVQEKAWAALVEIIAHTGSVQLLQEWDRTLTMTKQGPRRLLLLGEVLVRWQRQPQTKAQVVAVQELLVQAELDHGKWMAAGPRVRELLAGPGGEDEIKQRLRWLLTVGEQALHAGNREHALQAVRAAQPFLVANSKLAAAFEALERKASGK